MLAHAFLLFAAVSLPHTVPFEITSNKPFVQASIDGSAPQWFILDTGCRGNSMIARECAERLHLERGAEEQAQVGAGSGAAVGLSQMSRPVTLHALGDTITVAEPLVMTLGHVARIEGRRVDGLIGEDFLQRHVVELDYATNRITLRDPAAYKPPAKAVIVPIDLESGWPVAEGTITTPGGKPLPCRLIIDTGVRSTVTLFRPFSTANGLYGVPGALRDRVTGYGVGGASRGDVGRLETFTLGALSFSKPVAVFSRDTTGIFAMRELDGIVGGELLKRHRVTFDYPHRRMVLEPVSGGSFEFDMSGVFLATEAPEYATIRVVSVQPGTPAAKANLQVGDELVSIDGVKTPELKVDEARALFRSPGVRRLELRREGKLLAVRLETRRLV